LWFEANDELLTINLVDFRVIQRGEAIYFTLAADPLCATGRRQLQTILMLSLVSMPSNFQLTALQIQLTAQA